MHIIAAQLGRHHRTGDVEQLRNGTTLTPIGGPTTVKVAGIPLGDPRFASEDDRFACGPYADQVQRTVARVGVGYPV